VELFKGEKLGQMLLKFAPLCSPTIHNLIASLKHHLGNFDFIDCILNERHYMVTTIFKTIIFLINRLGRRFICSRCSLMELHLHLI
jgi:hypothetical protein